MFSSRASRKSAARSGSFLLTVILIFCVAPRPGFAAELPQETDHDMIQRLIRQNDALQARLKTLEAKLNVAPPLESALVPVAIVPVEEPQVAEPVAGVKLRVFGDVGYQASDAKGEPHSFQIGSLDMFMSGNFSDRLSVLSEVLFIPKFDNSIGVDIERLLLQYKHNDRFSVSVGRFHSAIGYYNTAYHQGAWFQTAVDRPFMYAFDDMEGFLPLQEVGISAMGEVPSGKLGLHFVAEIGNGRNHLLDSDPAQNNHDHNNGKSLNLAFFARPLWVPGLQTGFSVYRDYLTFSDNINHSEMISTVHVVYTNANWEFLNEGMLVRHVHTADGAPGVFHTPGAYTQISRKIGDYRPYFRYAYVNAGVTEPIYGDPTDGPVVGRRNGPSIGLRLDFNEHAAFKIQYDHQNERGEKSENAITTQFSFAF